MWMLSGTRDQRQKRNSRNTPSNNVFDKGVVNKWGMLKWDWQDRICVIAFAVFTDSGAVTP